MSRPIPMPMPVLIFLFLCIDAGKRWALELELERGFPRRVVVVAGC